MTTPKTPAVYIPHGGGPCFFMDWQPQGMWDEMGAYLKRLPQDIGATPKALLIISAHWEESEFTVQTKAAPGLLFDYYGFPEHTYQLKWPAPGSKTLAARVQEVAAAGGITIVTDETRDYDHGVFIPMLMAWPDAGIPTIQLSLKKGLNPQEHMALGRALAPLRDEGVAIIGSGMSFHSIPRLMGREANTGPASHAFDTWLQETLNGNRSELLNWASAPNANDCHPREEHLIPLMVIAGAGGNDDARMTYHEDSLGPTGIAISAFQFG